MPKHKHYVELNGERIPLRLAASKLGVNYATLYKWCVVNGRPAGAYESHATRIVFRGQRRTISEWAARTGLRVSVINGRLQRQAAAGPELAPCASWSARHSDISEDSRRTQGKPPRRIGSMTVPREVPDRIWWCFECNGGVGVWGVDMDKPPPRCPACHKFDFAPVKFVPANETPGESST